MTTKFRAGRRLIALAGTVAVTMAGVISLGSTASAAVGPDQPGAPESGTLTINKLIGAEGSAGDGTEQNVAGTPLEGAEFTVWKLGKLDGGNCVALDLTKTGDWELVPDGTAPVAPEQVSEDGLCLVDAGTKQTTGEDGKTTFNLDLGLYYVQETDAPANIVSRTAPFYVSIPLPHPTEQWLYDVNVYPKNQELNKPIKEVNTDDEQPAKGVVVGDVVEWTITQTVPALNEGETYQSASVTDVLPSSLAYNAAHPNTVTLGGTELVLGTDYEFDDSILRWTLTEPGLGKLEAGQELKIVFSTTVLEVTETGAIENGPGTGEIGEPGYSSEFNGGTTPGEPTPLTYWGEFNLKKTDEGDEPLANAKFAIFNNADNGVCADEAPTSGALATGESDANGVVQWTKTDEDTAVENLGLWVANSNNGPLTGPTKTYCVYEVEAPAGYVMVPFVNAVTIEAGKNTAGEFDLTVKNSLKDGPDLPLTGGQGTLLMTIGGLLLMVVGGAAIYALRRREA